MRQADFSTRPNLISHARLRKMRLLHCLGINIKMTGRTLSVVVFRGSRTDLTSLHLISHMINSRSILPNDRLALQNAAAEDLLSCCPGDIICRQSIRRHESQRTTQKKKQAERQERKPALTEKQPSSYRTSQQKKDPQGSLRKHLA